MTREQAKAEREAFCAFCDGVAIQSQSVRMSDGFALSEWIDDSDPQFTAIRRHRIKPQTKMVPLGPEDVPPGSVFRHPTWTPGCHETYLYVSVTGVTFQNRHVSWEQVRNLEILRPGGNWTRAEKEETK